MAAFKNIRLVAAKDIAWVVTKLYQLPKVRLTANNHCRW